LSFTSGDRICPGIQIVRLKLFSCGIKYRALKGPDLTFIRNNFTVPALEQYWVTGKAHPLPIVFLSAAK
jgi:hypothetical protein